MTRKNLHKFAVDIWGKYQIPISEASKNDNGVSLVDSEINIYNFDEICKSLFHNRNLPASADGICFSGKTIQLVEFKSGFKQRVTKENFDKEKEICDEIKEKPIVCEKYWKLFWENQIKNQKELMDSIRLKAIESYILLEKNIFPLCEERIDWSDRIVLKVVVDAGGEDGIEDTLMGLSGKEKETDNCLLSIRQSLMRLIDRKDSTGDSYFYDEVEVLSVSDYINQLKMLK